MSGKFTHYLITRFNVPVKNWDKDKAGKQTLDESWMKDRMWLFTTYCVPTIIHQTQADFQWLVYCDQYTDPVHLDSLHIEVQKVPGAQVRVVTDFTALLIDLRELLSSAPTPFVITSRVDNDDGIGTSYIHDIQANFIPEDKTIINLNGGILFDLQQRIMTRFKNVKLNHYGSLIEVTDPRGGYLTVLGYPHHQPPEEANVVNVPCRFGWLKIIHSRNLKSRTSGIPVLPRRTLVHFGLKRNAFPISVTNTILYTLQRLSTIIKRNVMPGRK